MYNTNPPSNPLSDHHRRQLEVESGITREVHEERGVRTITHGRQLPKGFSRRQRRRGAGILFTIHRPNGDTSYSFRPDATDPENPGRKYEQPSKYYGGPGNVLDVHPKVRDLIGRSDVPAIFVEGIKKGDAIVSAARAAGVEVLVVVISGVYNWLSDGDPIPDMFEIPVEARRVIICFDSDMLQNPSVQQAAQRLAEHFEEREAKAHLTFLPDQDDGSKNGADDFLAGGASFEDLLAHARPYDPTNFARVRIDRDDQLRHALADLERILGEHHWHGQGGHTDRDVFLKLTEAAARHGKVVEDGVRLTKAQGTLALEARVSTRTLWRSLKRLEEAELLYRDNEDREPDKPGAFVLRARVRHSGTEAGQEKNVTEELQSMYGGNLPLRAPRLRWSSPGRKPSKKQIHAYRTGKSQVPLPHTREPIIRLGKTRGAILDIVDVSGGSLAVEELAAIMGKRARDIRRRLLPMLEERRIVTVVDGIVQLTANWLGELEAERIAAEEVERDRIQWHHLKLKRQRYHGRHKYQADPSPPEGKMYGPERLRAARARREERMRVQVRDAFVDPNGGPRRNLEFLQDGEMLNVEALVKSVLRYLRLPFKDWELWRDPVLHVAAGIARRASAPPPVPEPPPEPESPPEDYRDHSLDCECDSCLYPEPRYARPYAGSGRRSA